MCCTRYIHEMCVAHAWYTQATHMPRACCRVCATCVVRASYVSLCMHGCHTRTVWHVHGTRVSHACHVRAAFVCATCVVCVVDKHNTGCGAVHTTRQRCFTQNMDDLVDIILRRIRTHNIVVFPVFKNPARPLQPSQSRKALCSSAAMTG